MSKQTKKITLEYPNNFDDWEVMSDDYYAIVKGPCGHQITVDGSTLAGVRALVDTHNKNEHATEVPTQRPAYPLIVNENETTERSIFNHPNTGLPFENHDPGALGRRI